MKEAAESKFADYFPLLRKLEPQHIKHHLLLCLLTPLPFSQQWFFSPRQHSPLSLNNILLPNLPGDHPCFAIIVEEMAILLINVLNSNDKEGMHLLLWTGESGLLLMLSMKIFRPLLQSSLFHLSLLVNRLSFLP